MNRSILFLLAVAASAVLAIAGCASQPRTGDATEGPLAERIAEKPQIWLPGASGAEVKSIAMGAAHSQGWALVDEEPEQILLERPMDPAAPQAVALGVRGASPPVVQVTGYFLEQSSGVRVALTAQVQTQGPDGATQTLDWSEAYRDDLMRSLESLRATWSANRQRVAAALAARRSMSQSPELAGEDRVDLSTPPSDPLKAAWAAETTLVDESTAANPSTDDSGWREPSEQGNESDQPTATGAQSLEAEEQSGPAVADSRGMLALDQTRRPGMWTYYAERYASTHGCTLTEEGALLVDQQPGYEIHVVACWNQPDLRLRCHNGVCSPIR